MKTKIKNFPTVSKRISRVFRLKIALDLDGLSEENIQVLRKYGQMQDGITREVLVPANMTLHALHYVIQRLFGWQNSHLHRFMLPDSVFQNITGGSNPAERQGYTLYDGRFVDWAKLCGMYFRWPSEDYHDIYWDDDYEDGEDFKLWLKNKYTGPYQYLGEGEHYHIAQGNARDLINRNRELVLPIPFSEWQELQQSGELTEENAVYHTTIDQVSIREMERWLEGSMNELLERLPLSCLLVKECPIKEEYLREVLELIARHQEQADTELEVLPFTDTLCYNYDYGDNWMLNITLLDCYDAESLETVPQECQDTVKRVAKKIRPVCLTADGLPLMDDVGGIYSYTEFLREIHEEKDTEEAKSSRQWARWMGWTGRMSRPDRIL